MDVFGKWGDKLKVIWEDVFVRKRIYGDWKLREKLGVILVIYGRGMRVLIGMVGDGVERWE